MLCRGLKRRISGTSRKLSLRIPHPTRVAPFSHLKTSFGQPEWMRLSVSRRAQTWSPLASTNSPVVILVPRWWYSNHARLCALAAERSVRKMRPPRWTHTLSIYCRKSDHRLCYLLLQSGRDLCTLSSFVVVRYLIPSILSEVKGYMYIRERYEMNWNDWEIADGYASVGNLKVIELKAYLKSAKYLKYNAYIYIYI